jgi:hypothetical protein
MLLAPGLHKHVFSWPHASLDLGEANQAKPLLFEARKALASHAELGSQFRLPLQQLQAHLQSAKNDGGLWRHPGDQALSIQAAEFHSCTGMTLDVTVLASGARCDP